MPVIVTVNVPAVLALHDNATVAGEGGRTTLAGLMFPHVSPLGKGVSDKATEPSNPTTDVSVIVEELEDPARTAAGVDAVIVKSTKVKVAVAVCVR